MFEQILDLVGQPPGSLVYHFIILFAVEAALAISFGQWMRERDAGTARLTIAAAGLFFMRLVMLVAALLAWRGLLPRNVLLPPVERLADAVSIIALAWAFITMDDPDLLRRNFVPDVVHGALTGMAVIGFVGTYYFWFSLSGEMLFNGLWLDRAWALAQIVLAAVGLVWMLTRTRYLYDPFLKGIMLILLGAAAAVHLVRPGLGDVAAAVRLGQIIVMPMLAAVAYRHVVEQLLHWDDFEPSRSTAALPPLPARGSAPAAAAPSSGQATQPSLLAVEEQPTEEEVEQPAAGRPVSQPKLLEVVESLGELLGTLDAEEIVRRAPRAVATALRADIAVLAIVNDTMEQAAIVGGYDNIAQVYLDESFLNLANHPTMVNALGRLRQMRLMPSRNNRELRDLYDHLQISHLGPAYIQPLARGEERLGLLIVGTPYSERQLSDEERNLLDRLGPLVTAALTSVERHEDMLEEQQRATAEESIKLVSLADELTARTAELNEAQRKLEEMKTYVRDAYRRAEEAEGLRQEYERLKAAAAEVEQLRAEQEALRAQAVDDGREASLAPDFERLEARLEALERARDQLLDERDRLTQERDHLFERVNRIEEIEAENRRLSIELRRIADLEREIEALRGSGVVMGAPAPSADRAALERQYEEARLAAQAEIVALRTRLTQASITQQEVSFLQEQLALKARESVTLQARLTESQAVIEALREQLAQGLSSTRELEPLQLRVGAQAAEIARLQAELAELRAEAALGDGALRAEAAMDEQDRAAMEQLQAQLADRAALVETLEAQLADKTRALGDLRTQMVEVEAALRAVEKELASKTEETARLQQSLAETRAEAQARIDELLQQREEGEQVDVALYEARVSALQAELAERSAAVENLEAQLIRTREAMAELEQQLAATNRAVDAVAAGQQSDSHDEVIASIAQELRTPMSSIIGYTDVLLGEQVGILGSLQRKFLQRVKSNTERMGALLDDLIRITALDKGRLQIEPEKVNVVLVAEEVITALTDQYREKELTLRLSIVDEIPQVTADRDAVAQILNHLLANAALASPVSGEIWLTIDSRRAVLPAVGEDIATPCLYIAVEDSGVGIDDEDFERVFMRKYRADNPLIEGLGDTGVGLSLTRALVEAHGGRIWLESRKGYGTTFHVLIPHSPIRLETEEA